jgi:hypothetical protein
MELYAFGGLACSMLHAPDDISLLDNGGQHRKHSSAFGLLVRRNVSML